jgi:hypothetical protein
MLPCVNPFRPASGDRSRLDIRRLAGLQQPHSGGQWGMDLGELERRIRAIEDTETIKRGRGGE